MWQQISLLRFKIPSKDHWGISGAKALALHAAKAHSLAGPHMAPKHFHVYRAKSKLLALPGTTPKPKPKNSIYDVAKG